MLSLLHRFRGAWAGALIGEALAHRVALSGHDRHHHRYQRLSLDQWSASQAVAMTIAEALLQAPISQEQDRQHPHQDSGLTSVVMLPIVLLYGDDSSSLMPALQQWELCTGIALTDQEIVAHTLGLLLHDRCTPSQLLIHLADASIAALGEQPQVLSILRGLLQRGASLTTAQDAVTGLPLATQSYALALYCFLSTPDDSRLCLERAMRCTGQPIVATIAGMFAGAFNGMLGMPIEWRDQSAFSHLEPVSTMATRLFARWCGVYDGRSLPPVDYDAIAIAVPGVIRPRSLP